MSPRFTGEETESRGAVTQQVDGRTRGLEARTPFRTLPPAHCLSLPDEPRVGRGGVGGGASRGVALGVGEAKTKAVVSSAWRWWWWWWGQPGAWGHAGRLTLQVGLGCVPKTCTVDSRDISDSWCSSSCGLSTESGPNELLALSPSPPGLSLHLSSKAWLYHMSRTHRVLGWEAFTQENKDTTCRLELYIK